MGCEHSHYRTQLVCLTMEVMAQHILELFVFVRYYDIITITLFRDSTVVEYQHVMQALPAYFVLPLPRLLNIVKHMSWVLEWLSLHPVNAQFYILEKWVGCKHNHYRTQLVCSTMFNNQGNGRTKYTCRDCTIHVDIGQWLNPRTRFYVIITEGDKRFQNTPKHYKVLPGV